MDELSSSSGVVAGLFLLADCSMIGGLPPVDEAFSIVKTGSVCVAHVL